MASRQCKAVGPNYACSLGSAITITHCKMHDYGMQAQIRQEPIYTYTRRTNHLLGHKVTIAIYT